MDKSSEFRPTQVPPGIVLWTRPIEIEVSRVRALTEAIGKPKYQLSDNCRHLSTSRTLYVVENADNSYELITDISTMFPDIQASPATLVSAIEIERRPESTAIMETLRDYSSLVDANRRKLPIAELLKLFFKGRIEAVMHAYLRKRSIDTRGLTAFLNAFGCNRVPPETFYRHQRKFKKGLKKGNGNKPDRTRSKPRESAETPSPEFKDSSSNSPPNPDKPKLQPFNEHEDQKDLFPDLLAECGETS